mmetsp:Transcript_68596/g.223146  ORF Transcript_68596/g.223146 Transcript_68596/m.223146 type:complete len:157 (-) Transcript_68596:58-528(-)
MLLDVSGLADWQPQRPDVPDLFEQWCWEGDEFVLPKKWEQALAEACEGTALPQAMRPWESASFDREGIFFLTHRSDTGGIAIALPGAGASDGVVGVLGVHPSFRRRGLGRCLLRLCVGRLVQLGRTRIFCAVDADRSPGAFKLLTSEGFRPSPAAP